MKEESPKLTKEQLEEVERLTGIEAADWEYLVSGAANHVFRVKHGKGSIIVKICKAELPGLFRLEAEGLNAMGCTGTVAVPVVHGFSDSLLLLEDLGHEEETVSDEAWFHFGTQFGAMHRKERAYFGYPHDNYLGIWIQENTPSDNWVDFYFNHRVACYFHSGRNDEFLTSDDFRGIEEVFGKIHNLIPSLPPALCHGDFWINNLFKREGGDIVLIDPAVFFGHPEADLALTLMHGPFPQSFFEGYGESYPLIPGWKERLPLYQFKELLLVIAQFGHEGAVRTLREIIARFR